MPIGEGSAIDPPYVERRFEALEAATGQTPPSYSGTPAAPASLLVRLASGVVGASPATVAHGLSYTPKIYSIVMTTAGIIYQQAAPDATNIYLQGDAAARQANVWLGR